MRWPESGNPSKDPKCCSVQQVKFKLINFSRFQSKNLEHDQLLKLIKWLPVVNLTAADTKCVWLAVPAQWGEGRLQEVAAVKIAGLCPPTPRLHGQAEPQHLCYFKETKCQWAMSMLKGQMEGHTQSHSFLKTTVGYADTCLCFQVVTAALILLRVYFTTVTAHQCLLKF